MSSKPALDGPAGRVHEQRFALAEVAEAERNGETWKLKATERNRDERTLNGQRDAGIFKHSCKFRGDAFETQIRSQELIYDRGLPAWLAAELADCMHARLL